MNFVNVGLKKSLKLKTICSPFCDFCTSEVTWSYFNIVVSKTQEHWRDGVPLAPTSIFLADEAAARAAVSQIPQSIHISVYALVCPVFLLRRNVEPGETPQVSIYPRRCRVTIIHLQANMQAA